MPVVRSTAIPWLCFSRRLLSQFQPLELDSVGLDLSNIVVRLLRKPAFCAASEDLRQPYGHFRGNPTLFVHQLRQGSASDSKRGSCVRDGQAERFNALAQYKAAWVRWILHRHGSASFSVVIDIINVPRIMASKAKDHPPVGANSHRPKTFQIALERMQPE